MRANDLQDLLRRQTFEPLRIHISSGETVDIRHPELALLTRSTLVVGIARRGSVAEHLAHYNLLHIVKVEPINGSGRRATRPRRRP